MTPLTRDQIAWRAAQDIWDGACVNLGVGMPSLIPNYIPAGREVVLQAEVGIIGMGPTPKPEDIDPDIFNASAQPTSLLPGGSTFSHTDSFLMIRGGHLDLAMLGAFEVSERGDLANWNTGDPATPPSVGGAMDLAVGAKAIRVLMDHTTKDGRPRILKRCRYPLTAPHCVKVIYTNLAVIDVTPAGLMVRETVPGLDFAELQAMTEAALTIAPDWRVLEAPAL
ncbi:MAG: 3-oxoacid CoA-transferase subunit B [Stellaceae bacterium]